MLPNKEKQSILGDSALREYERDSLKIFKEIKLSGVIGNDGKLEERFFSIRRR